MSTAVASQKAVAFTLLVAAGVAVQTPALTALDAVPTRTVARTIEANNSRRWRAAFDLGVTKEHVLIDVRIRLIPTKNVTAHEIRQRIPAWEAAIDATWSEHFLLQVGGDHSLPIRFRVSFGEPEPHHRVTVGDFAPAHDQLHWSLHATAKIIAHEFGHMIGAFDEYPGGGTAPEAPVIDPTSIMGDRPAAMTTYPRHLWLIRAALGEALRRENFLIVPADRGPAG